MNKDLSDLVQTNTDLARLCDHLEGCHRLAVDTEFERSRTFYVRPALLQLGDGDHNYLVDPLKIDHWKPLLDLLETPRIPKILHSASEDLEVIDRLGGNPPAPLFDTQIAASLLGLGYSISYRALVQALCDVDLPKSETRSNWLRRPLSPAQLEYARLDVAFLPSIYDQLQTGLEGQGRAHWMLEECTRLVSRHHQNQKAENAYLRFERSSKLSRREIGVLRALAAWREHEARDRDRPRGFVLRDETLMAIARRPPQTPSELLALVDQDTKINERDASVVIRIVDSVMGLDIAQLPSPFPASGDLRGHGGTIKALKGLVQNTAKELDIAPEILAHRRALEDLAREVLVRGRAELTAFFRGWRADVIGERLLERLQSVESG